MKLTIDTDANLLVEENNGEVIETPLYTKEGFEKLSHEWLKLAWNQKYTYTFSWLGRPIIQLPEDMVRIQELIYEIQPDVIVETGVAHGGSAIYYASLCKMIGKGRVIGVDIEIRPKNREAIENHELFEFVDLIESDSIADETLSKVKSYIKPEDKVLVILDSCHTAEHVYQELSAYHSMVSLNSYLIVTDGFMKYLDQVPRGNSSWKTDNPCTSIERFLSENSGFEYQQPNWPFNESQLTENLSHWPLAYLKRIS